METCQTPELTADLQGLLRVEPGDFIWLDEKSQQKRWLVPAKQRGGVSISRGDGPSGAEIARGCPHPRIGAGLAGAEGVGGSYAAPNYKTLFSLQPPSLSLRWKWDGAPGGVRSL